MLIENNIPGNIEPTIRDVKTLVSLMKTAIAKKDATLRLKLKFARIIGSQIGPTCTPKSAKESIVRLHLNKSSSGDTRFVTRLWIRLIRKLAVIKASSQYL
jgi:hypothetical protein